MAFVSAAVGLVTAAVGWLGSTALGSIALNMAVGVGLSLVKGALLGGPDAPQQAPAGITGTMGRGGTEARGILFGRFATAGSLLYAGTRDGGGGSPNVLLYQVICLSDVPVDSLTGMYVGGERCTIDFATNFAGRGHPIKEYEDEDGEDNLWVKFYDGTQTSADNQMVQHFGNDPEYPWTEDAVVKGCAYVVVTARLERSLFSGWPQFVFELKGAKWYDIRKDTTAGGSGTQRFEDRTTWAFTDNPAVIAYNLLRGVRYDGQWLYGLQKTTAAQFPFDNWSAAMDVCDAQVQNLDGDGAEARYRAAGEIRVSEDIIDPLKKLMTACEGRIAEVGGVYKIHIGEPDAPVLTFDDGDIVSTEGQDFDPFRGLAEQLNGIAPRYPNVAEAYQEHPGPTRWNEDRITAVGGRQLPTEVGYDYVPFKGQVQRLTAQQLAEYSRQRRHTIVLPPWAQVLEPVDYVRWNSSRNGYDAKIMRVEGMEDLPLGDVRVQLVEVDAADYDFDPATQYQPDPDGPIFTDRPAAQAITGWQAFPETIYDAEDNARRPTIGISCEGDADDVKEVHVQVRLAADDSIIFDALVPYGKREADGSVKTFILNGVFLPNTVYEVRGKFVPFGGRRTTWSAWLQVTTFDIRLGAEDLYPIDLDQLGEDVQEKFGEIDETLGLSVRQIRDRARQVSGLIAQVMEQAATDYEARDSLRHAISVDVGKARSDFRTEVELLASVDSALATRIDSLSATVAGNAASFTQQVAVLTDADTALGLRVDDLTAEVGANTASIASESQARADADSALADQIDSVSATLGDKADAITVQQLTATVTQQGTTIQSQGQALTAVQTEVGRVSAGGYLEITGSSGPSGVLAQAELAVRVASDGRVARGAITLQGHEVNGDLRTRAIVIADDFILTDGTNTKQPFVFSNGVLYADELRVRWAQIDDVQIDWADITNVQIDWADIDTAVIDNLEVGTSNLSFKAVTDQVTISGNKSDLTRYDSWETVDSLTIESAVGVFINFSGNAGLPSSASGSNSMRLRRSDGVVLWSEMASLQDLNVSWNVMLIDDNIPTGQYRYDLQIRSYQSEGGVSGQARILYWKR